MSSRPDTTEIERFVAEWQGPMFNLAHRMLRDGALAEDLTQDIIRRAIEKRAQLDPARPVKPWIYRLGTNTILNHIRAAKTRRTHEAERAGRLGDRGDAMQRRESEEAVQTEVRALPEAARALLVLHYYSGLSKTEIAQLLDIPRTTVQSRMTSALTALRARLGAGGFAALSPIVEATMQATPAASVPPRLRRRLSEIVIGSATAASAGLPLGGLIVTKKLAAMGAALLLIGSAGGYWVGRTVHTHTSDRAPAHVADAGGAAAHAARRPDEQAAALDPQGDDGTGGQVDGAHAIEMPPTAAPSSGRAKDTASPEQTRARIDWSRFTEMLANDRELFAKAASDATPELTAAERATATAFIGEFMRLAELARGASPTPSIDPDIFSEFAVAFFDSALPPGETHRTALREQAASELRAALAEVDVARALPVQLRVLRGRVSDRVGEWVTKRAGETHAPAIKELLALLPSFMGGGDYQLLEVGVGAPRAADQPSAGDQIVLVWQRSFGLTDGELPTARDAADVLVQGAVDELRRRGLDSEDTIISAETHLELDRHMRELQLQAEAKLAPLLSNAQVEKGRGSGPVLMRFLWGSSAELSEGFGGL